MSKYSWLFIFVVMSSVFMGNGYTKPFINEIHYDNVETDVGEFIEIAGVAGTDLTGWSILLYNGAPGGDHGVYSTTFLSEVIDDQGNGFGTITIDYDADGIQNGGVDWETPASPDGIALVDADGIVVQFFSYEGSFIAANGAAAGMTSTDIGVFELMNTAVGDSLQLVGTGINYQDFTWAASTIDSYGILNRGQVFDSNTVISSVSEPGVLVLLIIGLVSGLSFNKVLLTRAG